MEPAQAGTHWAIRHPVLFPFILFLGALIGTAGGAFLVGDAVVSLGQIATAIALNRNRRERSSLGGARAEPKR